MFFWVSSSLRHVSDNFQVLENSMVNNDKKAIFNHQFDLCFYGPVFVLFCFVGDGGSGRDE